MDIEKEKIFRQIITGKMDSAIKNLIEQISRVKDDELKISIGLLCFDHYELLKKINKGILTTEEEFLERRKIANRMLQIIIARL